MQNKVTGKDNSKVNTAIKGKKILVTGADGFIGSHLTEELVKQGAKVRALSYYNCFNSWGWLDYIDPKTLEQIEVISGDIRDPFATKKMVQGCDLVFHLAALIAIPYSYNAPDSYVETNIKGTLNILEAAREMNVIQVIQTSTSEVYGTAQFIPITEEHPLNGQSPYAATKIGADQMALAYFRSYQLPVSVIRPFNTYGPRQSARAIIPTIITQIANNQAKIKLGSLTPTRDFSFVKDTVRGFIAAAGNKKSVGEVINLGSGFEISIKEIANVIAKVMDKSVEIETDASRVRPEASEVERLFASITKAKSLLGWEPEYGGYDGFAQGIKETTEWFTSSENLKKYKSGIYNV